MNLGSVGPVGVVASAVVGGRGRPRQVTGDPLRDTVTFWWHRAHGRCVPALASEGDLEREIDGGRGPFGVEVSAKRRLKQSENTSTVGKRRGTSDQAIDKGLGGVA
jgi:hypothetical protein